MIFYLITHGDGESFQVVWPAAPESPGKLLCVQWRLAGSEAHGRESFTLESHRPWQRIETIPDQQHALEVTVTLQGQKEPRAPILKAWGPETRPFVVQTQGDEPQRILSPRTTIIIPEGGVWLSQNSLPTFARQGERHLIDFISEAPLCRMTRTALSLTTPEWDFSNTGAHNQHFKPWHDAKQSIVPPTAGFITTQSPASA